MRALNGGTNEVRPGNMTVDMCIAFCGTGAGDASGGKTGKFAFVGLEYARYVPLWAVLLVCLCWVVIYIQGLIKGDACRECWCAQSLSSLSVKLADSACNLPCEGNTTQACGGSLKLTVCTVT